MKIATYTKAQAWRLEDLYIYGYKREGIWGRGTGKVPANDNVNRGSFNVTPAGRARQARAKAAKEQAYRLIVAGHQTVKEVRIIMNRTDTPVRRYFRQLEAEGRIKPVEEKPGTVHKWVPV
jgi:hypothetical protein